MTSPKRPYGAPAGGHSQGARLPRLGARQRRPYTRRSARGPGGGVATHDSAVDQAAFVGRVRGAAARERGHLPARVLLLLVVVTCAGVLLSAMFLPTAIAASDAVDAFETEWLDIPPLPEDFEEAPENSVILA